MRQKTLHSLLLMTIVGIGLAGCQAKLAMDELAVDSKVQAKVSLPVGEVTTSFGNMIGLFGSAADIHVNEQGLLEMTIDEHRKRDFHKIELKNYIGRIDEPQSMPDGIPMIYKDTEQDIPFTLAIQFNGINGDTDEERLDSLVIDLARFTTNISPTNLNITDDDVQKVTMKLGPQFHRAAGTEIELKPFHLNTDMPIEIDNFNLVMMKNADEDPSPTNVLKTADITFVLTLKTGQDVTVTAGSGFHFTFEVEMMSYNALYGYFKPSKETSDSSSVEVPIKMPGDNALIMPAKDPEISLLFTYGMSMPLEVYFHYIKAIHPKDETTSAIWDGSPSTTKPLNNMLPMDAAYDATVQNTIILDKKPTNGTIDKFFEKEVTDIAYKYDLVINSTEASVKNLKQFRLTKNTDFVMDFHFKMPFDFKPGLKATYNDTIREVNLERASLDSLAAMTNGVIKSIDKVDLTLYLAITNEIPVNLTMDVEFLDENDNVLALAPLKDIKIAGAEMTNLTDIKPSQSAATIGVQTKDFDLLSKTRSMLLKIRMGDDVKESAFPASKKLNIKVGVTGDIEAALYYEFGKKTNK